MACRFLHRSAERELPTVTWRVGKLGGHGLRHACPNPTLGETFLIEHVVRLPTESLQAEQRTDGSVVPFLLDLDGPFVGALVAGPGSAAAPRGCGSALLGAILGAARGTNCRGSVGGMTLARLEDRRPNDAGSSQRPVRFLVGLDITPLRGDHSIRGIGRYVRGVVDALLSTQADWCNDHLGLLVAGGQDLPTGASTVWRSRRASFRAQDIGWLVATAMDHATARGRGVDIWHETDPANPLGAAGAGRALVTAYDLIPLLEPDVMKRIRPHRRLPYQLHLRGLQSARAVVAISQATATDVHSVLGVPEDRIRVVYPAVEALQPAGSAEKVPVGVEPSLVFVGVPDPHKRADLAVEALAAYRGKGGTRRLVFVGYHPPEARVRLQRLADLQKVGSQVQFWDRVDDGTLAGLYRTGILLAVSRREGFGLPPVECLLTGGRTVATPTPIYREVLGSAAVFAVDDSAEAIAEGISQAEDERPDPHAIEWLAHRYAPASVARTLISVYESVLP